MQQGQKHPKNHPQDLGRQKPKDEGFGEIPKESTYASGQNIRVNTDVKTEGFGEIPKESTYAGVGSTQLCRK